MDYVLTLLVLVLLLMVRNNVTYRIRREAFEIIFSRANWQELDARDRTISYERILFDLTVWNVKQAYPWLFTDENPNT